MAASVSSHPSQARGTPRASTTPAATVDSRSAPGDAGSRSTSRANAGSPQGPASRGWSRRWRRTPLGIERQDPMRCRPDIDAVRASRATIDMAARWQRHDQRPAYRVVNVALPVDARPRARWPRVAGRVP